MSNIPKISEHGQDKPAYPSESYFQGLQEKSITDNFKREARKMAMQLSHSINPFQHSVYGNAGLGGQTQKPSIETILSDADKIYQWLIKEL